MWLIWTYSYGLSPKFLFGILQDRLKKSSCNIRQRSIQWFKVRSIFHSMIFLKCFQPSNISIKKIKMAKTRQLPIPRHKFFKTPITRLHLSKMVVLKVVSHEHEKTYYIHILRSKDILASLWRWSLKSRCVISGANYLHLGSF